MVGCLSDFSKSAAKTLQIMGPKISKNGTYKKSENAKHIVRRGDGGDIATTEEQEIACLSYDKESIERQRLEAKEWYSRAASETLVPQDSAASFPSCCVLM